MSEPELSFAGLLRQLRAEARLTQEELAEAASLSPQAVSTLERGIHRTAHVDTAVLLADALGLPEQARVLFVAAARSCRSSPAKLSSGSDTAQHPPDHRPPRLPGAAPEPIWHQQYSRRVTPAISAALWLHRGELPRPLRP